jgi:histidinol-phosphate aminotransferase
MFNLQTHLSDSFYLVDRKEKYCYDEYINLSSNEFIHPLTDKLVTEFIKVIEPSIVAKYPYYPSLYGELSQFMDVSPRNILISAGSDDAIKMICESLILNTGRAIIQSPNYDSYYSYCKIRGIETIEIKYLNRSMEDFIMNLFKTIEQVQPSVVIITNPNGFTGEFINIDHIDSIASVTEKYGHILLIDEAYSSFAGFGHQELLKKFSNVVILHSFSKSFGVCGLRIGMLMSSIDIIDYLSRWKSANPVSGLSLAYLKICLKNYDLIRGVHQELINCREWFRSKLKSMFPYWIFPHSHGNFVFVDTRSVETCRVIHSYLLSNKVMIRSFFEQGELKTCLRITVASREITQKVLNLIAEIKDAVVFVDNR